jgi:hypothetical protein
MYRKRRFKPVRGVGPAVGRDQAAEASPASAGPGTAATTGSGGLFMQRRPSLANLGGARTVADAWDEWHGRAPSLETPTRGADGRFEVTGRSRGLGYRRG